MCPEYRCISIQFRCQTDHPDEKLRLVGLEGKGRLILVEETFRQGYLLSSKRFSRMELYATQYKRLRSRLRYWMASEIWAELIVSSPAKSAMVRPTFKILV